MDFLSEFKIAIDTTEEEELHTQKSDFHQNQPVNNDLNSLRSCQELRRKRFQPNNTSNLKFKAKSKHILSLSSSETFVDMKTLVLYQFEPSYTHLIMYTIDFYSRQYWQLVLPCCQRKFSKVLSPVEHSYPYNGRGCCEQDTKYNKSCQEFGSLLFSG